MANLKDIKTRIQSVQNTRKITRAMKMVAAAKVKKAESTVKSARPFATELSTIFKRMLSAVNGEYSVENLKVKSAIDNYPVLLEKREIKSVGLLVMSSNKGLAGAYNANIILTHFDSYLSLQLGKAIDIIDFGRKTGEDKYRIA